MASPTFGLAGSPHPPTWVNLPHEITAMILQKLETLEILVTAMQVCTTWRNICKDPSMWRVINIHKFCMPNNTRKMCREAVNLSQGQLVEIKIEADDEMIHYIAERSPKMRRLQIFRVNLNTWKTLSKAVNNFPLLEEIYFLYTNIDVQTILDIATLCPLLTSLSLQAHRYYRNRSVSDSNKLAFAVSRMPKLLHLQLVRSWITNKGLTAILDGCTQLESLDLRKCCRLKLGGKLGKRCRQQIKHLKLPKNSTEINEFGEYSETESFWDWDESDESDEESKEELEIEIQSEKKSDTEIDSDSNDEVSEIEIESSSDDEESD